MFKITALACLNNTLKFLQVTQIWMTTIWAAITWRRYAFTSVIFHDFALCLYMYDYILYLKSIYTCLVD